MSSRPPTDASYKSGNSYKSVGKNSYVEEDLFGSSKPTPRTGNRNPPAASGLSNFYSGGDTQTIPQTKQNKPEVIQLITKDLIRTIKVPSQEPQEVLTLSTSDYARIKKNATVRSQSADERRRAQIKQEREQAMIEAQKRREEMKRFDSLRTKNEPLSDLDQEARAKNEFLLKKAQRLLEEQEDEIKQLNELIISSKCHAIREAQIAEKQIIKAELAAEEARLDELMEIDRVRAIKQLEEREHAIQLVRTKRAGEIKAQILERQQQRLIDHELKDQETQIMLEQLEKMQEEDKAALQRKNNRARMLLQEANKFNEMNIELKKQQDEIARIEAIKAAEFLKAKEQREEEIQKEEQRKKRERANELAKLLTMQESALDEVAERHAIEAKRQAEAKERLLRQKDKEEALAKQKALEQIQRARAEQVMTKTQFLEAQAAQDRDEFERVLDAQKELIAAEEAKHKAELESRLLNKKAVISQIRSKEQEKTEDRKAFFEEGVKLDQEAKARAKHIEDIKLRKLAELEELGVPEQALSQIKRKIHGGKPKLTMST